MNGEEALKSLNGFYALAFYDRQLNRLVLARDLAGIKPLLVFEDDEKVCFASEMTGLTPFTKSFEINPTTLNQYFSLTYTAAPETIANRVNALMPGEVRVYEDKGCVSSTYLKTKTSEFKQSYSVACDQLEELLSESVARRMVSDVPLGTFLSGGLDSSIIAALAKRNKSDLKTFSVGFDHPYFNESNYSSEVSKHIDSHHFEIIISKNDFKQSFTHFLDALDQPFADSSAFAMYLLAKKTKEEVTVALSGDGADELFAGYRKHMAAFRASNFGSGKQSVIQVLAKISKPIPEKRAGKFGDFARKIKRLNRGLDLGEEDRYWFWCQFITKEDRESLLKHGFVDIKYPYDWGNRGFQDHLLADQQLVLPNDMLKKVDAMSMAHGLQVRTPFLDRSVIEFAQSIPTDYKINRKHGKRILRDTFSDLLPKSILTRSKKGFEIPLAYWLEDEIVEQFQSDRFSKDYLIKQDLFNVEYVMYLKKDLKSAIQGDRIYLVWALIVFQFWWDKQQKKS